MAREQFTTVGSASVVSLRELPPHHGPSRHSTLIMNAPPLFWEEEDSVSNFSTPLQLPIFKLKEGDCVLPVSARGRGRLTAHSGASSSYQGACQGMEILRQFDSGLGGATKNLLFAAALCGFLFRFRENFFLRISF